MHTYVGGRIYRVKCRDVGAFRVSNNGVYEMALIGSNTSKHGPLSYNHCYK